VANARSKAETLAGAGDASLGQVVSIQESFAGSTPPIYYGRDSAAGAETAASTPIQPPTLETQVSVTVTWSLT
jgi:uncharacterized protein YggE